MSNKKLNVVRKNFLSNIYKHLKRAADQCWLAFERLIVLLGGRTIAMLAVTLLITIVSVLYTDNWLTSVAEQDQAVSQIRKNILLLQELKTHVYRAESAQRGYLYTERANYIEPFNNAINEARENIRQLDILIASSNAGNDKKISSDWMKIIAASLESKAMEMKLVLSLNQSGMHKEAKHLVNLDEGLVETKKFMDYTNSLIKKQGEVLEAKIKDRAKTISIARFSSLGGALLLIWLVVLVIKQLLEELAVKSDLQLRIQKENVIYEEKLQQQTKLLRSLALDYQSDVERERHKLSRELHDELGSIFTATKMDIAWVIKKMKDLAPTSENDIVNKLRKTTSYLDQGIQYQRHIVQELHPAMLTTFGFWPALNSLIYDAAERNQWHLELNLPDENTVLNETLSLVTYRVIQETLNNANKYSKASKISIDVMIDEKFIKLEIEDNGIGFDVNSLSGDGKTYGLSGMRHRILAIGGNFEITSSPGKGVFTRAVIPLDFQTA